MIAPKIRLLFFAGLAALPIALSSCADPQAYTTTKESIQQTVNINTASDEELKKLADKLNVPDLPEKIKANRPYNDIDELVSKQVISPPQLDYIQNDILVKDVPAN
jgi:DNA uptake protein ComE-like DNA-binding protein